MTVGLTRLELIYEETNTVIVGALLHVLVSEDRGELSHKT